MMFFSSQLFSSHSLPTVFEPCCGRCPCSNSSPGLLPRALEATHPRGWQPHVFGLGKGDKELPWPPEQFLLGVTQKPCHFWLTNAHRLVPAAILPRILCVVPSCLRIPQETPSVGNRDYQLH